MPGIKLYVACHKQADVPEHALLYPVQAGAALASQTFANMLQDNVGDNISYKNTSYCELTVQYWVWKNQIAEYYGFFHYRRFLLFQTGQKKVCEIYLQPNEELLLHTGYEQKFIEQFIANYDILMPHAENTAETVYEKYAAAPGHFREDLDLMMALIAQYYPEYKTAMEQYVYGHKQYYFNMYVMKHEYFQQYCQWLFPLLEQFDKRNDHSKYQNDKTALRVNGYLAERMLGIWYTYQKQNNVLRTIELPYMYFAMGDKKVYCKQWMKNKLLPAGSKRKYVLKKFAGKR